PGIKPLEDRGVRIAEGTVRHAAATGGFGSELVVSGSGRAFEIVAAGKGPTEGFTGVTLDAGMLNGIGAGTMAIGGAPGSQFETGRNTQSSYLASFGTAYQAASGIVLREGAVLSAPQVFLVAGQRDGGIVLEQGAGIDTLRRGPVSWDSKAGYVFKPGDVAVLAVSNGWLDMLAPSLSTDTRWGQGPIRIGVCEGSVRCGGTTTLYAEGTITAATDRAFELGDSVRYGARNLVLAVGGINVGSAEALERARGHDAQPAGARPPAARRHQHRRARAREPGADRARLGQLLRIGALVDAVVRQRPALAGATGADHAGHLRPWRRRRRGAHRDRHPGVERPAA
ncbi:hypothetical protein ACEN8K_36615, partial [Variovorax sp. CT11-76]